jgi:hypothetical protein
MMLCMCYDLLVLDDVVTLAAEVIDTATARVTSADADGAALDHVAIEAIIATAAALETAREDPRAALLVLHLTRDLLAELPAVAGHGALQDALGGRLRRSVRV